MPSRPASCRGRMALQNESNFSINVLGPKTNSFREACGDRRERLAAPEPSRWRQRRFVLGKMVRHRGARSVCSYA